MDVGARTICIFWILLELHLIEDMIFQLSKSKREENFGGFHKSTSILLLILPYGLSHANKYQFQNEHINNHQDRMLSFLSLQLTTSCINQFAYLCKNKPKEIGRMIGNTCK